MLCTNYLTSKITCSDNATVGTYYTVNVTGTAAVKQAATTIQPSTTTTTMNDQISMKAHNYNIYGYYIVMTRLQNKSQLLFLLLLL